MPVKKNNKTPEPSNKKPSGLEELCGLKWDADRQQYFDIDNNRFVIGTNTIKSYVHPPAKYTPIAQAPITNDLIHSTGTSLKKRKYIGISELINNNAEKAMMRVSMNIAGSEKERTITNTLQGIEAMSRPVARLLDYLFLKLTTQIANKPSLTEHEINSGRVVSFSIKEYMNFAGLKDYTTAKEQVNQACKAIQSIYVEWSDKCKVNFDAGGRLKKKITKNATNKHACNVFSMSTETELEGEQAGFFNIAFNYDFALIFSTMPFMPYPEASAKINANTNPHAFYLCRKLAEHYNMNLGKSNYNTIKVTTLLKACPDMPPLFNQDGKKKRNYVRDIIEPFERDLNSLYDYGILSSWDYRKKNGAPLNRDEWKRYRKMFENLEIVFSLRGYPQDTSRLAKIGRRTEKEQRLADKVKYK